MHLTCRGFIIADVYHIIRRFVMKLIEQWISFVELLAQSADGYLSWSRRLSA